MLLSSSPVTNPTRSLTVFSVALAFSPSARNAFACSALTGSNFSFWSSAIASIALAFSSLGQSFLNRTLDHGIGIAPEHHEAIFALFRRLHGREDYGGGAGAGLTLARRIVERHGGMIWVQSAPGQGTTMFFTLEPT